MILVSTRIQPQLSCDPANLLRAPKVTYTPLTTTVAIATTTATTTTTTFTLFGVVAMLLYLDWTTITKGT